MTGAIAYFKECIKQINIANNGSLGTFVISKGICENSIKALKKQIPKKLMYKKQSYGTPWLCPICEADQVKVEFFNEDGSEPKEKYSYCWNCGQKLDWSENK